ncbi:hypothetical protein Tco_0894308 [Tanacetum coccineum]|uniref:Uncharacterized protein n=1 Tax=Tanacetum coccineum TaxID=301880 RepID=A0ABQ5CBE1_9ASTR
MLDLSYQHGSLLNIYVPQMGFEDMVSYLKWKIPRQFTTLYYMLPPNYALSGMKQIKNDYHTNVMYDIAKVAGKLQIFVAHTPIDLSTVLIPNDGSFEQSLTGVISVETKIKLEESLKYLHQMQKRKNKKFDYYGLWGELEAIDEETILEEQILALMHRFADRFADRRVEINNMMVLHDHPLVDYGKYALGCMTGADMKKCVYLKSVRDELLRSMEEKRQLMANYRDM